MATKLVYDRTRQEQDIYSGVSEMAPLQMYPGGYGTPEKVVMVRIDPDFNIDADKLETVEEKKFSGISEVYNVIQAGSKYFWDLQIRTLIDEHFGIKADNVESVKEYKVRKFMPKTSDNKTKSGETTIDPAFKI